MPPKTWEGSGNLPHELTSFVGRRDDVTAARRRLAESRLLTLTGVGGVGKSRLAVRVAGAARRAFPDGVWLIELERLEDESLLAQTIAAALELREPWGAPPLGALAEHLADRQLLLILDNCEHLIDASARAAEALLRAGPGLRILATSREALEIDGETLQPVPPLATPEPGTVAVPEEAGLFEAVALFADRAQAVLPGFALTGANLAAVVEICHRLDGLSLAIELAAARLRVLSPEQLNSRLGDRLALLTGGSRIKPPRQQTLRACVGWSFDLCTPPEQRLWEWLSVFAGDFEWDAVEHVCAAPGLADVDPFELLAGLVSKSVLVREDRGAVVRYRMLENLRAYGTERLRASGAEPALRRRHREFYERLVLRAEADWISSRQVEWLARLDRELPNLRAALEFGLTGDGDPAPVQRMVSALRPYWVVRGMTGEARNWAERALAGPAEPTPERVAATYTATALAAMQGDDAAATALARSGREVADRLADPRCRAIATFGGSAPLMHNGDVAGAVRLTEQALAVFRAEGDLPWTVMALAGLAMGKAFLGDADGAAASYEELVTITEARGEVRLRGFALGALGVGLWKRGETTAAAARLKQSLRLRSRIRDTYGTAVCLDALAWIAVDNGRPTRAATLLGVVGVLTRAMGSPTAFYADLTRHHEQCESKTRQELGERAMLTAVTQGEEMTIDEAIAYALGDGADEPSAAARPGPVGAAVLLTPREWQICELVSEGLSNRELASRLVISPRTAESHVQNVMTKLGCSSRARIAAWTAARRREREFTPPGDA